MPGRESPKSGANEARFDEAAIAALSGRRQRTVEQKRIRSLVAKLTGPDGSVREVDGYRPGNTTARVGDVVRWQGAQVELVARGQDRARSPGR